MTGHNMNLEETKLKYAKMFDGEGRTISPRNLEVLNKIFKELILSLTKPLLEFDDILLEDLLYPSKVVNHPNNGFATNVQCLGHSKTLELIFVRSKIIQLNGHVTDDKLVLKHDFEFIPGCISQLQVIHRTLIHVLQNFSELLEKSDFSSFYKQITMSSIANFEKTFTAFKMLDQILQLLLINVQQTGLSDGSIFNVDASLLNNIKSLTQFNSDWFDELVLNSNALDDYIKSALVNNMITAHNFKKIVSDPTFQKFMVKRKLKLKISNRKVF